jgi:transporter family-2 protein
VIEAAAFSALVTTTLLHLVAVARGGWPASVFDAVRAPPWLWIGGLMGALGLGALTYAPPRIGVFGMIALFIAGQLTGSVLIDGFGWLGADRVGFAPLRLAGIVLVAVGAVLALRR